MKNSEIRSIQMKAKRLELMGWRLLQIPKHQFRLSCNGIGPEWFPEDVRKFIDKVCPSMRVSAAIHDRMYEEGYDFTEANRCLYYNGRIEAKDMYQWFDPRRHLAIWRAKKFAKLCQVFGYPAWRAARKRKFKNENSN